MSCTTGSCNVIVRSARPPEVNVRDQWNIAARRFLKPVRKVMCTKSHISQPRNPDSRRPLKLTTAWKREIVAMLPRSR